MLPLDERLHTAFNRHWGWGYSLDRPQILAWLPGLPVELKRLEAPRNQVGQTNCTVLGAWLLRVILPKRWTEELWLDIQVGRGATRPWSGMEGLVKHGLGERDDAMTERGVYAVQSWSNLDEKGHIRVREGKPRPRGHFRFVTRQASNLLYVREASQSRGGVVARLVGNEAPATWGHEVQAVRLRDD